MEDHDVASALDYYNLESYLFHTVRPRFHLNKELDAFDFFSIVIWKANRAKSRVAHKLLEKRPGKTLDEIVRELTSSLHRAPDGPARLKLLLKQYRFRLPIASAILTVLWPEAFSVYDVRVCEMLGEFRNLADIADFDVTWNKYADYLHAVGSRVSGELALRDKDRVLWAQSAMKQLRSDIASGFNRGEEPDRTP